MRKTESRVLVDSSAWIEYFFVGDKHVKEIIESGQHFLFCSALSIHEVKKKLLLEKYSRKEIQEAIDFMRNNSIVVDVTEEICERSADDAVKEKLHTADSIIYRTAKDNKAKVVTLDSDFKKLDNVIYIG